MKSLCENEFIELKRSTSDLKEAAVSIVAILNKHRRGELYFGVRNDGSIIGQDVSEKTLREVSQAIADNIEPKIYPKITSVSLDGKSCVRVEFEGKEAPYYADGKAYIRVADENKKLSAKELENMIIEKNKAKLRWDSEVCKNAAISDISKAKLKLFLKNAGLPFDDVHNSLEKLGLIKEGLTNASIILFGKKPEKFFANAALRCAVFAKDDTTLIVDRKEYYGDMFFLIQEAEEYFIKNIHLGMRVEGLKRIDVPEIDKEAFREAIVNAFCHRDYYEPGAVELAIFKDRVEIRSPGGLFGGLTLEKITTEMVSKRRNELIASILHKVHYIERWGRGIRLIQEKEPGVKFKVVADIFVTAFERKAVDKTREKSSEETAQKTREKTREKILALIKENPSITTTELAEKTRVSIKGIEWNISNLKKKGILKRIGPDKGGHWEVSK